MNDELDGITLLRYAHIYRSRISGGAEQYLKQLNDGLLAKNRMTILQMHLVTDQEGSSAIEVEPSGSGQIIWIPVCLHHEERSMRSLPSRLKQLLPKRPDHERSAWRQGIGACCTAIRGALRNSCGHLRYPAMILSDTLVDVLDIYKVDLITFHLLSYDAGTLVSVAIKRHIPFAIINHFDNCRLGLTDARRWIARAAGIGGVSNRNVPAEIRDRYVNLSDAVDVDFCSPAKAQGINRPKGFLALLPSRIAVGKGHNDLLVAARELTLTGLDLSVAFAGAVDSESLRTELESNSTAWGLRQRVLFLGQLTSAELRDWYAASDVVVLPSNSEGLGRVLLEAQAMEKPVIAYDSGGIPEALVADKTGFLVKVGDHAALSERIRYLSLHSAARLAMGKSGRKFIAERFSVPALVDRHERFYLKSMANRRTEAQILPALP